jgi:hypothetical protein
LVRSSSIGDIPLMSDPASDTSPEALDVMSTLYRRMSPEEKLRRVRDLTLAANAMAIEGLRARHTRESEAQLLMRLARIRLGDDLVAEAYGS